MEYLWSDRRRRLGLPLSFTRYALGEDRLFVETGLLTTQCEEILLYRVRDLSLRITLGQRIFGVGTVTIQSSDRSCPVLELKNVKHPRETKEIIHQAVENMKIQRRSGSARSWGTSMSMTTMMITTTRIGRKNRKFGRKIRIFRLTSRAQSGIIVKPH